jgi:hypothetical protein
MTNQSIRARIIFLLLLIPAVSQATFVTVSWSGGNDIGTFGTGVFSGHDTANNGIVTFATLDNFLSLAGENLDGVQIDMGNLSGFGSFDINANTWIPDGNGWKNEPDNAWFTWDADQYSINLLNTGYEDIAWQITSVGARGAVPEPGSTSLFVFALLGFAALRRKNIL